MKRLEYQIFPLQMRDPWSIASRQGAEGKGIDRTETVFVRLIDPALGLVGLGEASPVRYDGESAETIVRFVRMVDAERLDFSDYEGSAAYVLQLKSGQMAAKCALCCALADGAAQLKQVGLDVLAGLEAGHGVGLVSSFTIGLASPEVIERKVRAAAAYPILKLKVGLESDRENLAALRRAAPEVTVRLDANEAWTDREVALRRIEEFARDPRIEFIEQPMPADAPGEDEMWLKARSPLPLYADESYHTAANIDRVAEGFHGVNVKLVKAGGPIAAATALRVARARGLQTMLGCMVESSWLISAAARIASLAEAIDLDGAALSRNDPFRGAVIPAGRLDLSGLEGQCGVGARLRDPARWQQGWHACG